MVVQYGLIVCPKAPPIRPAIVPQIGEKIGIRKMILLLPPEIPDCGTDIFSF